MIRQGSKAVSLMSREELIIALEQAMKRITALEAALGPVTDAEWDKVSTTATLEGCTEDDEFIYREELNALIHARLAATS